MSDPDNLVGQSVASNCSQPLRRKPVRNYFKYPPLEWRKRDDYCTPQGPSFSGASPTRISLAGSYLRFEAPRHSPRDRIVKDTLVSRGYDVLAEAGLADVFGGSMATGHWQSAATYYRRWA